MYQKLNMRFLVLVLTGVFMLFVSSICSAASYPKESVTPLAVDLSMNQYKLNDVGDIITKGPWVDARIYNGGAFNDVTISAAITAIGANKNTLLIAPGTWTISNNVTVPSNINLRFEQGAILSIGTGITFTINGPLDAPLSQIFSWTGTGKVVFGSGVSEIFPQWWGAVGNGTTDCSPAIQATIDSMGTGGTYTNGTLLFPVGKYLCNSGINTGSSPGIIIRGYSHLPYYVSEVVSSTLVAGTSGMTLMSVGGFGKIENLTFDGNNLGANGLVISGVTNGKLDHVAFKRFTNVGCEINEDTDMIVLDTCWSHNNNIGFRVRHTGSANKDIQKVYFINSRASSNTTDGIVVDRAGSINIIGGSIDGAPRGLVVSNAGGGINSLNVLGMTFEVGLNPAIEFVKNTPSHGTPAASIGLIDGCFFYSSTAAAANAIKAAGAVGIEIRSPNFQAVNGAWALGAINFDNTGLTGAINASNQLTGVPNPAGCSLIAKRDGLSVFASGGYSGNTVFESPWSMTDNGSFAYTGSGTNARLKRWVVRGTVATGGGTANVLTIPATSRPGLYRVVATVNSLGNTYAWGESMVALDGNGGVTTTSLHSGMSGGTVAISASYAEGNLTFTITNNNSVSNSYAVGVEALSYYGNW